MKFLDLHPYPGKDLADGPILIFDCPCLNGSRIRLPIGKWSVWNWADDGPNDLVTITPSIDCRPSHSCHFNITSGEVFQVP